MIQEIYPDLLCIATRQTLHACQIETAVKGGVKGILCDKPLATTLSEMDRIVDICKTIPFAFALDRRWSIPYLHLTNEISNGIVGPIQSLVAYGLPNLINHGCHWYDILLALLGDPEPIWVSGFLDNISNSPINSRNRLDPLGRAQIGLKNGIVAYITPAGLKKPSFEIVDESGTLSISNDATEAYLWRENTSFRKKLTLPNSGKDWPTGTAMVQDPIQAMKNNNRTACDIVQASRATEIGFAIHNSSAQNGAKVSLPTANRSLRMKSFPWGNE